MTHSPIAAARHHSADKPGITLEHVCIAISHVCPAIKAPDLICKYESLFDSCNRRDVELFSFALEVGLLAGRQQSLHGMANGRAVRALLKVTE